MAKKITQTPKSETRSRAMTAMTADLVAGANELAATVQKATKPKRGQPSKFTQERWERILETVATYGDLIELCQEPGMPSVQTIYRWLRESEALKDDMRGAWEMFSMIGQSVNNNILRGGCLSTGDYRRDEALAAQNRWFMGKTNRRDFGDKTQVDVVTHQPVILGIDVLMGPGGSGV